MKYKKKLLTAVMLLGLGGLTSLQAQEDTTTAGGEASGSGGSASYTVGQVVYTTNVGTNGNSVAEGVQQPYEISVVTGIPEAKDISLSVSAYPNPTSDYLTIKVENYKTENLQYVVFDISGKLLQQVKSTGNETSINIQDYPAANYFVKVYAVGKNDRTGILDKQKEIKVFKIIKTQ